MKGECIAMVNIDAWRDSKCRRKNGHGRAGLYCKMHAKRNPDTSAKTTVVWLVDNGNIRKLHVVYETKMKVFTKEGYSYDKLRCDRSFESAKARAIKITEGHLAEVERSLIRIRENLKKLEAVTEEFYKK